MVRGIQIPVGGKLAGRVHVRFTSIEVNLHGIE